jgi:hypothetical protein
MYGSSGSDDSSGDHTTFACDKYVELGAGDQLGIV